MKNLQKKQINIQMDKITIIQQKRDNNDKKIQKTNMVQIGTKKCCNLKKIYLKL